MCLILLGWHAHPKFPLVVAANRDEFYARRTAAAAFWNDAPHVLGGRDLEAGGSWLGVTRTGRFAALTNFRNPSQNKDGRTSRGRLVSEFLLGTMTPEAYLDQLQGEGAAYNGFSLIFGQGDQLAYFSNCGGRAHRIQPGIHGLSNHLLDTPWPKVARGKAAMALALGELPDETPLLALLRDRRIVPDEELPQTGMSPEWERWLSPAFIHTPTYGTRSSTAIVLDRSGKLHFTELSYSADRQAHTQVQFELAFPAFQGTSAYSGVARD